MGTRTQTDVGWWMGFPWARGSAGFGVARTTRCTSLLEVTQLFFLFNCDDSFCSLSRLRGLLFTYSNFLFFYYAIFKYFLMNYLLLLLVLVYAS